MTKEVLLYIRGSQMAEGESDEIEFATTATYHIKNGKHYVMYEEETDEQGEANLKCMLKFDSSEFVMTKRGITYAEMVFAEGETKDSIYNTPAGPMEMRCQTSEYRIVEEDARLQAHIRYQLEINGSFISENTIYVEIKSQN